MRFGRMVAVLATLVLVGCASAYGPNQLTGGYSEKDLGQGQWRVFYGANGYTTRETAQSFWLYHCAELALAQGYDGFEIRTPMNLSAIEGLIEPTDAQIIKVHGGGGGGAHYVYVPVYGGPAGPSASMLGEIQLIKKPFAAAPPHRFDAQALKTALAPYVLGKKCDLQNVCPHVHFYLSPDKTSS